MHIHENAAHWNPVKREHNNTSRRIHHCKSIHMIYALAFSEETGFSSGQKKKVRDKLIQLGGKNKNLKILGCFKVKVSLYNKNTLELTLKMSHVWCRDKQSPHLGVL